jgi:hypothetical protein
LIIHTFRLHDKPNDTLSLFNKMKNGGCSTDAITYMSVLTAIADLENLTLGKQLHAEVEVIAFFHLYIFTLLAG